MQSTAQFRFGEDDFNIYEKGYIVTASGTKGADRGGHGCGRGGPATRGLRGAFRGGRGSGRPALKPVFDNYSDLTPVSSEASASAYGNQCLFSSPGDAGIIPFNIVSPDILRVK